MTLETNLRRFSGWAGACVVLLGLLTLLGWVLHLPQLRGLFLPGVVMSLNAALCFMTYGLALVLLSRGQTDTSYTMARAIAGIAMLFTMMAWFEFSTGISLGLSQLFLPEDRTVTSHAFRGRLPINTIIPLVLLGGGLLSVRPVGRREFSLSTWLGLSVLAVSLFTLCGHGLAAVGLGARPAGALGSAVCLIILGTGLVSLRANQDLLRIFSLDHPMNPVARKAILLGVLTPLVFYLTQVVVLLGKAPELQEEITLFTAASGISMLGAVVYFIHRLQGMNDQRADAERTRDVLLARVQQQAANLQFEVADRTQELRTLHERMQFAIGSAGFGLWEFDFVNQRLTWDDRTLEIYGISRAAFRGTREDWSSRVHPEDRVEAEKSTADVLAGRASQYRAQFRLIRPDGGIRYVRAVGYVQRNAAGEILRIVGLDKDITRDREHDSELAELNERLQLALRAEGGGVWDCDLVTGHATWNARQCEIYGVDPALFDGSMASWRRLVHPEDLPRVDNYTILPGRGSDHLENNFRIVRPDGAVRHIRTVGYIYRNAAGEPARIVGLDRDVTAEIEMRDKLRAVEERLALALQASGEGMWDWDVPSGRVYFSPRWLEILGYNPDELPHTYATWEMLIHPEDFGRSLAALQDHCQGRTPLFRSEHRLRSKDGNWIWTLSRAEVVSRDSHGRPLRVVGMQGDITERKLLEQQLRRSQEISLQVGRLAQIGAWEVDVKTRKITWDPEVFRIHEVELGYQPSFPAAWDFFPPESRGPLTDAMSRAEWDGTPFDLELPFVTARNRRLWVRVIGRAEMRHDHVVRLFGALQDITNRHEAEQARHRLESQLFQAQKMETLGTLAGGIAHDFNNLLTGIMGYQDLALDGLTPDHESHHCIVASRQASIRARALVDQILTFSRPAGDSAPMSVDLAQVAEEARRFLRATVPSTIDIQIDVAAGLGRVQADPTQMHQVLLNLGSNAAHAMRSGGGVLRISLQPVKLDANEASRLGGLTAGPHVRMTITDTGHGIDPETLKRIFDPFFTTKNVGEGTGLGLSVVHGIVRAHHGAIQVTSALGQGARFDIYLPVSEAAAGNPDDDARPLARGQGEVVWILDDEELVARFSKLALERFGYTAVAFESPDVCLAELKKNPSACQVLVTDQTMPSMTGMELSAQIRSFLPRLPIIVMSGYFSKISPTALDQIGLISLLAKPFSVEEIASAVDRALHPEE